MNPNPRQLQPDAIATWSFRGVPDYAPVRASLPTVEESVTQIARGKCEVNARVASTKNLSLVELHIEPLAVGVSVFDPEHSAFILPISWTSEFQINGRPVQDTCLYTSGPDGLYLRGKNRKLIGVAFRHRPVVESLAALRGVDPDDVVLGAPVVELTLPIAEALRRQLLSLLTNTLVADSGSPISPAQFENEVLSLVMDSCLYAQPKRESKASRGYSPERIVRLVEERFAKANGQPVSLADLCLAASVSKSTLYSAFQRLFGEPPLAYLYKRRLTQARSLLLQSTRKRGAIKDAALRVGLTELGRFSVDYRALFGESPSTTLNVAGDCP